MLKTMWNLWDQFWFRPQSVTAICLYRICFGLLLIAYSIIYLPSEIPIFWGAHRAISLSTVACWWTHPLADVLLFWPREDGWMIIWYMIFLVFCVTLTVGFMTRLSAFIVWLWLLSIHHDTFIYANGSDVLMRLSAFYLIFSFAGDKYSVDEKLSKTEKNVASSLKPPWAQRLLQLQLSAIYFQCFWSKLQGKVWLDGSAVYYILNMDHYKHFEVAFISSQFWICQILSWSTLVIEFSLFSLIWFRKTRKVVLIAGVIFHVSIDITMNLPMFEYLFLAMYILFLDEDDFRRLFHFLSACFGTKNRKIATVEA